ncbi:sodium-coupled monocarboxylate transporter 2-like [Tenebrio molitor]|uniref:sodium-coupled monocarboxylate transporter 2-like n=1 Tax=Tenebrio molitor TaxID=7067 RepID=UPI0036247183
MTTTFSSFKLSWYDYVAFAAMLLVSASIGVYFGFFKSRYNTIREYLLGGRKMKIVPIALSITVSQFTGITLIGVPADVYIYGATYWLACLSLVFVVPLMIYVYLPVFYNLELTSTYEYLEKRFDSRTKLLVSGFYIMCSDITLALIAYGPALVFSTATGIDVQVVSFVVCGICVFYTAIGGLRTVIWTDVFQFVVIFGSLASIFVISLSKLGGFETIWMKAVDGGRLDIFDFDLDPTKRDSFWIIIIGSTIQLLCQICSDPTSVQKFLAVSTFKDAAWSVIYFGLSFALIITFCILIGLGINAKYSDCDPFITKQIAQGDQLTPYYVMDFAENFPGVFGLFIAGIVSAAMSTIAAFLNTLSGVIYKDFLSKFFKTNMSVRSTTRILKLIVTINGIICMCLVFVIKYIEGRIFVLSMMLSAMQLGPTLGLFTLGMLFPRANSKGAFYGAIGTWIIILSIVVPSQYYKSKKILTYPTKHFSTDGCTNEIISFANTTFQTFSNGTTDSTLPTSEPFFLFRISFYYHSLIGAFTTIFLGLVISYMTKKDEAPVDKSLISPVSHFLLSEEHESQYRDVESALEILETNSKSKDEN